MTQPFALRRNDTACEIARYELVLDEGISVEDAGGAANENPLVAVGTLIQRRTSTRSIPAHEAVRVGDADPEDDNGQLLCGD